MKKLEQFLVTQGTNFDSKSGKPGIFYKKVNSYKFIINGLNVKQRTKNLPKYFMQVF